MIKLLIWGEALDLPEGFGMDIEDSNPIFNDKGSQSIPATIPPTRRNNRLTHHAGRVDNSEDPNSPERTCIIESGAYQRRGTMNYTSANSRDGITFNVGFDNSTAYEKWKNKKLAELSTLPTWPHSSLSSLMADLNAIYSNADPRTNPLAIFPIVTAIDEDDWLKAYDANVVNPEKVEVLNMWTKAGYGRYELKSVSKVTRTIDGTVTTVSVPENYGFTPFVRVWRVLELVFSDLGLTLVSNPFKTDIDLARLVVLNNCADSCCVKDVKYSDLMPDVTVEAFMNALWVRFGLVYHADFNTCRASLVFIDDIVAGSPQADLSGIISGPPVINYEKGKYVKLSAASSIDSAKPETARFEDYAKDFDLTGIWRKSTDPSVQNETHTLVFAGPWCLWRKYDKVNKVYKEPSTSFFNWDPQPQGLDAEEMASDDEWVPIARVQIRNPGADYSDLFDASVPFYLKGMRHNHSYVKGSDSPEDGDTPLAFMFAFTNLQESVGRTEGRFAAVTGDTFETVEQHTTSLLFQYKGGLFDKYWRRYDEILRHAARTIEIKGRLKLQEIRQLDMFRPVLFRGVRCLIDTVSYSLPGGKDIEVKIKLRTIQTQGSYDIGKEQNIPDFVMLDNNFRWKYVSDTLQEVFDSDASKVAAVIAWQKAHPEYKADGMFAWVASAVPVSVRETGLTWETDPYNSDGNCHYEGVEKTCWYEARATYEIRIPQDASEDNRENGGDAEPGEVSLGQVTITVEYSVRLVNARP